MPSNNILFIFLGRSSTSVRSFQDLSSFTVSFSVLQELVSLHCRQWLSSFIAPICQLIYSTTPHVRLGISLFSKNDFFVASILLALFLVYFNPLRPSLEIIRKIKPRLSIPPIVSLTVFLMSLPIIFLHQRSLPPVWHGQLNLSKRQWLYPTKKD